MNRAPSKAKIHECTNCARTVALKRRDYPYTESGLSSVVLHGIQVAACRKCGNTDVIIPGMAKLHRTIAYALVNSPARLTGEQLRFLRKHLELSGEQMGCYLHTDRTKISKWENSEDQIGPTTDRLIRLLVAALDRELRSGVFAVAAHLPQISNDSGNNWKLRVNMATLGTAFIPVTKAA